MSDRQSFDVVVVGAGVGGLVAGVRAAELGLNVAVLEKGVTPQYPCNSRFSGGNFHIALHSPKLPGDELLKAIKNRTDDTADPALAATLAGRAGELMDWLMGHGAKFVRTGSEHGETWLAAPPRPLASALDWMHTWQGRGPDALLRLLVERLVRFRGVLLLGTEVESLVMSNNRCIGVEAVSSGERENFESSAVILADGGFQANLDLLRENIAPVPEALKQRNVETGTGDGLRMARAIGAATTRLDRFYGHVLSRDALRKQRLWPYPILDDVAVAGIVVDHTGRRFVDEGYGGVYIANVAATAKEPTVIFDAKIWDGPGRAARVVPPNPHLAGGGGTIYSAASIAALAPLAKLPADALVSSVDSYNQACTNGSHAALDPPRTTRKYPALPIKVPPFYAVPACAGITYTMGGIKIDGEARVMGQDGSIIPGLYAAGSTTGGLEGMTEKAFYVGGLCRASVFGKQAAEHIARSSPRRKIVSKS